MTSKPRNPRARFLSIVVMPAVLPAILLPLLGKLELSDAALGAVVGVPIGLALAGLVWMAKGKKACATGA
ncbi:hypothetical protein [Croceibacterium aestuarii]|uniref:hypothetical protein n=1 Tax=Croceibacterium aestuarii TaxID=3064139 RepID=UPI00272E40B3|nr:hypothetical protein [Croceibacterium sp. D39]